MEKLQPRIRSWTR